MLSFTTIRGFFSSTSASAAATVRPKPRRLLALESLEGRALLSHVAASPAPMPPIHVIPPIGVIATPHSNADTMPPVRVKPPISPIATPHSNADTMPPVRVKPPIGVITTPRSNADTMPPVRVKPPISPVSTPRVG